MHENPLKFQTIMINVRMAVALTRWTGDSTSSGCAVSG